MSRSDLESQDGPVLVKLDPLLKEALHKPSILAVATDFVALNDQFTMPKCDKLPQSEPKTLVIGWVRTKSLPSLACLCLQRLGGGDWCVNWRAGP
jgi:hypothetical protein